MPTANDLVSSIGNPDHVSDGEMAIPPSTPKIPDRWGAGTVPRDTNSSETTLEMGAEGRRSNGLVEKLVADIVLDFACDFK